MSSHGKIYPAKKTLFLRNEVGVAMAGNGDGYDCSSNFATYEPIVHSVQTGKWFVLSWKDIVKLAVEAGIDKE